MKKVLSGLAAGVLAFSLFTSATFAAVSFDSSTGTGFVGKGDVQTALGFNNAQLQSNAGTLEFTYESVDTYAITVSWTTGEGTRGEKTHYVDHKRTSSVTSGVEYNARTAKQVNGFTLDGFDNPVVEGDIPQEGDQFPGNSGHTVVDVELVSSNSTLYVNGAALQ
ncbi:hypothetical protein K8O68_03670 [Salipaludibacillus sp. CUR1]|uniref:hypothetical protein n=1 Tax=Salipaludibacillus sp. CUR1 TaxID=2820003 RepID=UPI001E659DA2|nr:hypothetical protein [Salipaludibacillus sp. CUR1]MCE7791523.1 hypothetical protein [Salipaludibacillus sp. CUR1]